MKFEFKVYGGQFKVESLKFKADNDECFERRMY